MILAGLLLQDGPACAQPGSAPFDHITHEQGLQDRIINAMVQDAAGFMWFGSEEGLTRFDGYTCVVYRHDKNDPYSLSDNAVYALSVDGKGNLWIGTRNGVNRYDARNDRFEVFRHENNNSASIAANEVYALARDPAGNLWAGIYDGGVARIIQRDAAVTFHNYRHQPADTNAISNDQVFSVAVDQNGFVFAGTYKGLEVLHPDRKKVYHFKHEPRNSNSISNNAVSRIYTAADGAIWLCGYNMLDRIELDTNSFTLRVQHVLPLLPVKANAPWIINDFRIDALGFAWLATNDQGVYRFRMQHGLPAGPAVQYVHNDQDPNSLAASNVYSLYEDRSGITWIGTSKGVSRFIPAKAVFNTATPAELPRGRFAMAVTSDLQNSLWLAPDSDSILVYPNQAGAYASPVIITPVLSPDGFDQVNCMFTASSGDLYIGTMLQGFFIVPASLADKTNQRQWVHIDAGKYPAVPSNNIYAFAEDKTGTVWVGTYKGLCRMNSNTGQPEPVYVSGKEFVVSGYIIRCIAAGDDGTVWCGTDQGLIVIKEGKPGRSYRNAAGTASISSDGVIALHKDRQGNTWVGTKNGIDIIDRGGAVVQHFGLHDGLPDVGIRSIIEDRQGLVWVATSHGLARFNAKEKRFIAYGIKDGLPADQFVTNSACIARDGMLIFGTNAGPVAFDPGAIVPNAYIPPVVITQVKVMNRDITTMDDTSLVTVFRHDSVLRLSYHQNFFSFEFTALNYINSAKNRYAYMLEGVDEDWVDAGNQRFAGYTDIRPGHYLFKVKAANNDGVWTPVPLTIQVIIDPPWWQTWWFYLLCLLAVAAILYVIYRVRLRQMLQLYKLRSSIAKDLHDDVGSALSSIAMLSRIAQEGRSTAKLKPEEVFTRIGDTSRRMIDLMDDIVWSVNPDNDRFSNMLVRMREYAVEMLEPLDIAFTFHVPADVETVHIPMQIRKDYFLLYKEAVNNMAKYAGCTTAGISITRQNRQLITVISDNGKGFDPAVLTSGNGLRNMQARATAMHGTVQLHSAPGKGTTVTLVLPI